MMRTVLKNKNMLIVGFSICFILFVPTYYRKEIISENEDTNKNKEPGKEMPAEKLSANSHKAQKKQLERAKKFICSVAPFIIFNVLPYMVK